MGGAIDAVQIRHEIGGIGAIWYREWKVFLREKSRIVAAAVNPILWLVVFGGGLGRNVSIPGAEYQAFIFPGILAQAVLFSSIFFGVYIVWDRKIDFLKEVLVAPISRTSVFIGKVVGGATDSVVQSMALARLLLAAAIAMAPAAVAKGVVAPFDWVTPMTNGSTSASPMIAAREYRPVFPRCAATSFVAISIARKRNANRNAPRNSRGFLG